MPHLVHLHAYCRSWDPREGCGLGSHGEVRGNMHFGLCEKEGRDFLRYLGDKVQMAATRTLVILNPNTKLSQSESSTTTLAVGPPLPIESPAHLQH